MTTATQTRLRREEIPALFAVSRRAGKAIVEFGMIQEGDRIAVAVSGGKDSLSLLHVLRDRRRVSPVKFDFTAVHIDFEFSDFDPRGLVEESKVKCPANTHYYVYSLDYARKHCAMIERFGRFPHRNAVLGRLSTPDEIEFLKKPGSGVLIGGEE